VTAAASLDLLMRHAWLLQERKRTNDIYAGMLKVQGRRAQQRTMTKMMKMGQ
jgi:hypothetical protein